MTIQWHDIVGNTGVLLIVGSYLLLQLRRLDSESLAYSFANGLGAALIIVSLMVEWNLAAFMIEFFWLLISILGVILWIRRR